MHGDQVVAVERRTRWSRARGTTPGRRRSSTEVSTVWVNTAPPSKTCTSRSLERARGDAPAARRPTRPTAARTRRGLEPVRLGVEDERRIGREAREVALGVGGGERVDDGGGSGLDGGGIGGASWRWLLLR